MPKTIRLTDEELEVIIDALSEYQMETGAESVKPIIKKCVEQVDDPEELHLHHEFPE